MGPLNSRGFGVGRGGGRGGLKAAQSPGAPNQDTAFVLRSVRAVRQGAAGPAVQAAAKRALPGTQSTQLGVLEPTLLNPRPVHLGASSVPRRHPDDLGHFMQPQARKGALSPGIFREAEPLLLLLKFQDTMIYWSLDQEEIARLFLKPPSPSSLLNLQCQAT